MIEYDTNGATALFCADPPKLSTKPRGFCLKSPRDLALSNRETTPQPEVVRGAELPVELTRKIWMSLALGIHMLVTFHIWLWIGRHLHRIAFAAMLSLDFLDDVRRMNKRQVGAHFAAAFLSELRANVSRSLLLDA